MANDDRELLAEELEREVGGAIRAALAEHVEWEEEQLAARALLAELRKRRIVLYRRAVHTLPPGLHQVTLDELTGIERAGAPTLPEEAPALRDASARGEEQAHTTPGGPVEAESTVPGRARARGENA